ncbi:MAG: hypothetical protein IPO88_11025 [Nannocystis sp.]|uniref:hypothetical protein n=1 Tax=Nannocystis sp. TaxID=1962667 RepID=UPI002429C681|nr:hypothetical protein [Nannocystis sp.]MBK9754019.1 hypothetical protein [Nannocystis sp.]
MTIVLSRVGKVSVFSLPTAASAGRSSQSRESRLNSSLNTECAICSTRDGVRRYLIVTLTAVEDDFSIVSVTLERTAICFSCPNWARLLYAQRNQETSEAVAPEMCACRKFGAVRYHHTNSRAAGRDIYTLCANARIDHSKWGGRPGWPIASSRTIDGLASP